MYKTYADTLKEQQMPVLSPVQQKQQQTFTMPETGNLKNTGPGPIQSWIQTPGNMDKAQLAYQNVALPIMAMIESIASKGKSPGTAVQGAYSALQTGAKQKQDYESQMEDAKQNALERDLKKKNIEIANVGLASKTREEDKAAKDAARLAIINQEKDPVKRQELLDAYYAESAPGAYLTLAENKRQFGEEETRKKQEFKDTQTLDRDKLKNKGTITPERESKIIEGISKTFTTDPQMKQYRAGVDAADMVSMALSTKNPAWDQSLKTLIGRMNGEKGTMSDRDIERLGGSQAISAKIGDVLSRWTKGTMSEENRAYFQQVAKATRNFQAQKLNERATQHLEKYKKIYPQIDPGRLDDLLIGNQVEVETAPEQGASDILNQIRASRQRKQ